MSDVDIKKLKTILDELKKSNVVGVKGAQLTEETNKLMGAVEGSLKDIGFKFVADNGFGDGIKPPKIPGYDRIPDFAVDRNGDGHWDMIVEIKSSSDWDQSDNQLTDLWTFSRDNGLDFLVVVPKHLYIQASERYKNLGFNGYSKYQVVGV